MLRYDIPVDAADFSQLVPQIDSLPKPLVQGWGLSHDSFGSLYVSDGSSVIRVVDPKTWQVKKQIYVKVVAKGP